MTVFDLNNLLSLGAPVFTLLFPARMPAAKKTPLSMSRLWSHLIYIIASSLPYFLCTSLDSEIRLFVFFPHLSPNIFKACLFFPPRVK